MVSYLILSFTGESCPGNNALRGTGFSIYKPRNNGWQLVALNDEVSKQIPNSISRIRQRVRLLPG